MFGFVSNTLKLAGKVMESSFRHFHALPTSISSNAIVAPSISNQWSLMPVRTKIRNNFPVANEYKRLKKFSWRVKLQTKNGRRQIMRRILKGRFYLTH